MFSPRCYDASCIPADHRFIFTIKVTREVGAASVFAADWPVSFPSRLGRKEGGEGLVQWGNAGRV